ncbi:hypothetical protein AB0F42_11745 [Streptomyces buecherae]|uniref:hypothetical protein n=1 Tax=Streptomyces buecherae TaxID=2763006 RepID=UPI0033D935A6
MSASATVPRRALTASSWCCCGTWSAQPPAPHTTRAAPSSGGAPATGASTRCATPTAVSRAATSARTRPVRSTSGPISRLPSTPPAPQAHR